MKSKSLRRIKKTVMLVGLSSIIGLFSGCQQVKNNLGFEAIQKRGHIVVGLDDTFVPMGFKNEKGELVGFDVELAKAVGENLKLEVTFQPIDWAMKETELNSGNIDLIWNGYTITDARKEKVLFSEAYMENRQVIVVKQGSSIETKADLKGKRVGVQTGSSSLEAIEKDRSFMEKLENQEAVLFDTNQEAFLDLEAGRIDGIVADEILAKYYMTLKKDQSYKILSDNFGNESYGIGIRKNDETLKMKLDETLKKLKTSGKTDEIYKKWFGEMK